MGSSNYITNFDGEVSQHMEYFAFGETFVEEHKNSNNSPYKFNGKELDDESGHYYYGARYYDPRISIWASVDPLAEKGLQFSPYCYTFNNPITLIDPNGKWPDFPAVFKNGFTNVVNGVVNTVKQSYNDTKSAIKSTYNETKKVIAQTYNNVKEKLSNINLEGNSAEKGGGGYQFVTDGGTSNTDPKQTRKGNPDGVFNVTGIYVLAGYIGVGEGSNSFSKTASTSEKVKSVAEIGKTAKEGFDLGGEIVEKLDEYIGKSERNDTIFSVTRKIDKDNNYIDFVSGSKKADSIMKKSNNSVKKIEKIY